MDFPIYTSQAPLQSSLWARSNYFKHTCPSTPHPHIGVLLHPVTVQAQLSHGTDRAVQLPSLDSAKSYLWYYLLQCCCSSEAQQKSDKVSQRPEPCISEVHREHRALLHLLEDQREQWTHLWAADIYAETPGRWIPRECDRMGLPISSKRKINFLFY